MNSPWQQTPHNLCWDLRECKIRVYIYIYISRELNIFCNSQWGRGERDSIKDLHNTNMFYQNLRR